MPLTEPRTLHQGEIELFRWDFLHLERLDMVRVGFSLLSPARVTVRLASVDGSESEVWYDAPRREGPFSESWRLVSRTGVRLPTGSFLVELDLDGEPVGQRSFFMS